MRRCCWKIDLLLFCLLLGQPAAAAWCPEPLQPFRHHYVLYRNDRPVGEVRLTLQSEGDAWRLESRTEARRGMAGLLGARITEWVRFQCVGGRYRPLDSHYQRKLLFSKRETRLTFDWDAKRVYGRHRGKPVDLNLEADVVDRLGVQLLLAADLQAGRPLVYRVQDRHRLRDWYFEAGRPDVKSPPLPARAFKRRDDNPARETWFWLAPGQSPVPVQFYHREKKERYISVLCMDASD